MVIIAFSDKTSKILPRILCRKFRHCAPIIPAGGGRLVMYQFTAPSRVSQITLSMRDIGILHAHGWRFVYVPCDVTPGFGAHAFSCVDLSKKALRLRAWLVQTPQALYRHLQK